jgi:ribulose-phosphate 3-epimerase
MRISASLHAADPLRLADAVSAIRPYVESLHVDVMDGRFAPAFGFGERLVESLVADGALPIDVHVMAEEPDRWAVRFAKLGARSVAFHIGAAKDPVRVANAIRAERALAYVALLPKTPLSCLSEFPPCFDGLLLLTAPAGGGALIPEALARVSDRPRALPTMVDGRIGPDQLSLLRACGVDLAVIGNSLFESKDLLGRAKTLAALATSPGS